MRIGPGRRDLRIKRRRSVRVRLAGWDTLMSGHPLSRVVAAWLGLGCWLTLSSAGADEPPLLVGPSASPSGLADAPPVAPVLHEALASNANVNVNPNAAGRDPSRVDRSPPAPI